MASELTKAQAIKALYAYDVAPYLEYKERGGSKIPFVGWDNIVAILDDVLPGEWDSQQMAQALVGGKLVLTWRLTLHCADGDIIRESLGDEEEERDNYGTAATNAESQAKRRAAANFGLGLALYDKAKRREIEQRAARGVQAPPPRAANGNGHSQASVPPAVKSQPVQAVGDTKPRPKLDALLAKYTPVQVKNLLIGQHADLWVRAGGSDSAKAELKRIGQPISTDEENIARDWSINDLFDRCQELDNALKTQVPV